MKKYFNMAILYVVLGLSLGIFYREFTKFNNYEGITSLSMAHTHALVLGFMFMLILILFEKNYELSKCSKFNIWFITYNIGVIYLLITLVIRGILEVRGIEFLGLSHIAGLGHTILGAALIWFMCILNKSLKNINEEKK